MGKKLYVGNLSYTVKQDDLQPLFAAHGTLTSAQLILDRETKRSKGFAFVEMSSDAEAQAAISALNGTMLDGRALTVNEARAQEPRSAGFERAGKDNRPRRGPGVGRSFSGDARPASKR